MNGKELDGRIALVNGASRGIGEAIAHGLAAHGATVIASSRDREAVARVAADIEAAGETYPFNGILGGDHIIFVDFKRRYNLDARIEAALTRGQVEVARRLRQNKDRVGILVADSAGHDMTDAVLAAMLHQAFLTGVLYELENEGHVTAKLFEVLNTRFAQSSSVNKFLTMIYGEISNDGTFRFISAGHPKPLIFSAW